VRLLPLLATAALVGPAFAAPDTAPAPRRVIRATVESSLPTAGRNIRQFAFDADPATAFVSDGDAKKDDHLTLTFDQPVALRAVSVLIGRSDQPPTPTRIEVSADGKTFTDLPATGECQARAVRVGPGADLKWPLVIRDITVVSEPKVVPFRYPVEIALDVSDAPEMKAWGEKVVRVCEREYPDICGFLASDGYTPPTQLRMAIRNDYNGLAAAGGGGFVGSV
jgi:hypothetical protein